MHAHQHLTRLRLWTQWLLNTKKTIANNMAHFAKKLTKLHILD
jgi:hypothetical protein